MISCLVDVVLLDENDDNEVHMVRHASGVAMSIGNVNVTWSGGTSLERTEAVLRRLLRELDEIRRAES